MEIRKHVSFLIPAAIIIIVAGAGFELPNLMPQPTVVSVNGTVKLTADIQYAVFSGSCYYTNTVKTVSISQSELSESVNSSLLTSVEGYCGEWTAVYDNWVAGGAVTNLFQNSNDYAWYITLLELGESLCYLARYADGSCGWDGQINDFIPNRPPPIYLSAPVKLIGLGYLVTTQLTLSNPLPLIIDKMSAPSWAVDFSQFSCIKDCSLAVTLTSSGYSISNAQTATSMQVILTILANSAELWGFPFWSTTIGTTQKIITATLQISPSSSTVKLT